MQYTSPDEYTVTLSATCPSYLRGGFTDLIAGLEYEGHQWPTAWDRFLILTENHSEARYRPAKYDGYASMKGDYIVSYEGTARWYRPEIDVRCTVSSYYVLGYKVATRESYVPFAFHGTVEECGTRTQLAPSIGEPSYDIYSPGFDDSGCSETGGDSAGGRNEEERSGTAYAVGEHTGGETVDWRTGVGNGGVSACGANAIVEYVCIDTWEEGVGWVEWDCGYVTTC